MISLRERMMLMKAYNSTMTLNECVSVLRDMGISVSESSIALGLEQGVLPFGVVIQSTKRVFIISKKLLSEWCEKFCGKKPDYSSYTETEEYIYGMTLEEWNSLSEDAQIAIEQQMMYPEKPLLYDV